MDPRPTLGAQPGAAGSEPRAGAGRISTEAFVSWLERHRDVAGLCEVLDVDFDPAAFRVLMAQSEGVALVSSWEGDIQTVVDSVGSAGKASGRTPPPIHTDGGYLRTSPRIVFLYCVNPGRGDRPTVLLDSARAIEALDPEHRNLLGRLEFTYLRRGWTSGPRPVLEPHPVSGRLITNLGSRGWARPKPEHASDEPLLRDSIVAQAELFGRLQESVRLAHYWDRPGQLLVFDNFHYLHGPRAAEPDPARQLQQVFVDPR